jgi:tetratricopeptide (TPR) repeat protein
MPRPIKRRAAKPPLGKEADVKTLVARARSAAGRNLRRVAVVAVSVSIAVASVGGFYFYKKGVAGKADRLEYEGHKYYFGLYGTQPMIKAERYRKALESFEQAFELRESPFSLYYIAASHYALGNYDKAVEALGRLAGEFPREDKYVPLAYYKLAMAGMRAGKAEDALKALDSLAGYRAGPFGDLALIESARSLEGMGRKDEAVGKYKALVREFPDSPFFEEAGLKVKEAGGG